ncbi:hypothetical protein HMPREF9440_01730 [Sutterella parvirubra YIT 11816]|uniref:Uncharacterized protein n=1 Tax=Sutterella parvirubra YIT 11816 TaxID=762967 RepID=H3KG53_9BURK|nr:hypothetical protein HMPREF9440_01730 [Sutterella parvirubra YIT 11816]
MRRIGLEGGRSRRILRVILQKKHPPSPVDAEVRNLGPGQMRA